MNDFNVVGLPDNAVKESRERIKSATRNCGFEFPHGQGVTINLASADVRKEGSAFDLPMALRLVGCMGHFFGKPPDKCMFLSEISYCHASSACILQLTGIRSKCSCVTSLHRGMEARCNLPVGTS
jgi:predicted ATPase with chaperone activity